MNNFLNHFFVTFSSLFLFLACAQLNTPKAEKNPRVQRSYTIGAGLTSLHTAQGHDFYRLIRERSVDIELEPLIPVKEDSP